MVYVKSLENVHSSNGPLCDSWYYGYEVGASVPHLFQLWRTMQQGYCILVVNVSWNSTGWADFLRLAPCMSVEGKACPVTTKAHYARQGTNSRDTETGGGIEASKISISQV